MTQVLESQRTYDVIVGYPDANRESVEAVRATLIDTSSGAKVPLGALATIRQDAGPNVVMRENAQRRIVVMANVGGRDLKSVVDDVRTAVSRDVKMPSGYYVVYGGQFESESDATRTIGLLSVFVVAGIFLILFLALRSARTALLVMVNLPLALIGGVVAVKLGGAVGPSGSVLAIDIDPDLLEFLHEQVLVEYTMRQGSPGGATPSSGGAAPLRRADRDVSQLPYTHFP